MSYRTPSLPSGRPAPLVPWWQALEAWRAEGMEGLDVAATRRRLGGRWVRVNGRWWPSLPGWPDGPYLAGVVEAVEGDGAPECGGGVR